ncbi:MAG TPA: hypothetical protein VFA81_08130 [Burkholderiales bacterium]|nr:hypothetical protein [Burkholderiales bacterium]
MRTFLAVLATSGLGLFTGAAIAQNDLGEDNGRVIIIVPEEVQPDQQAMPEDQNADQGQAAQGQDEENAPATATLPCTSCPDQDQDSSSKASGNQDEQDQGEAR